MDGDGIGRTQGEIMSLSIANWMWEELERIPFEVRVRVNPSGHSVRGQFMETEKQLELASAAATWEMAPSSSGSQALSLERDLSDTYSHADLPRFKKSFRKKAFIYLFWDGGQEPVAWFREIMELMAPDVIVVPVLTVTPDNRPEEICLRLRPVAGEYARRMDWGWEE